MVEKDPAKILWDDKEVMGNQVDIVVAAPNDSIIRKK